MQSFENDQISFDGSCEIAKAILELEWEALAWYRQWSKLDDRPPTGNCLPSL
jgi:hypothetical protein